MPTPYTKEQQLRVRAGTPEAEALLKRVKKKPRESKNKYGALRTAGSGGRMYDSGLEARYSDFLETRKLAGEIKGWKAQHTMELRVNGELAATYRMDFVITHNDGQLELIEVKGAESKDWRLKWQLTKALLPKGEIKGIPKDSLLTLVKSNGKKFVHHTQLLNYE